MKNSQLFLSACVSGFEHENEERQSRMYFDHVSESLDGHPGNLTDKCISTLVGCSVQLLGLPALG